MVGGAELRAARCEAGLSLTRMAQRAHFSKSYLSMVETGKRPVAADVVEAYEQVLAVPIWPAKTDPVRIAHEWLVGDSPARIRLRSGRLVGEALVSELDQRVVELRHLDDLIGHEDLLPAVTRELSDAQRVVRELSDAQRVVREARCPEPVGRRLCSVVGELAQLAGWIASDAGRCAEARRHYLNGVSAAEAAGDRVLGAQLLSSLSYQMTNVADPRDALLLARTALIGSPEAPPVARTLFLERVAWAAAKAKDSEAAARALDAVDDAYESRDDSSAEPEWVYWLDRGEIDVMAGRCLIELGKPMEAESLLRNTVSDYPEAHAREVALYLSWLAEAHVRGGDLDAAYEALQRAETFASSTPSTRVLQRLQAIRGLLRQCGHLTRGSSRPRRQRCR